jgi:cytochrome c553
MAQGGDMSKRVGRIAVALIVLVVVFGAVVWIGSELVLRKLYTGSPAVAPALPGDVESGKHWAAILGCTSCHDLALQGSVMEEEDFWMGLLAAPNVTIQRKLYDDAALARLLREGVKHDGHGVDTMPSNAFHYANDQTIADVIAFVRSVPDSGEVQPKLTYGPLARWNFLTGEWKLMPEEIRTSRIGDQRIQDVPGRYIAVLACGECHGLDQRGGETIPNLAVAKAYSLEEFTHLMRTGEAKGGRKLRTLMAATARRRFSVFSDDEIAALKAYLDARDP